MPIGLEDIRNRFGYHKGTGVTMPKHERVREAYIALAEFLDVLLPDGRAKSTAFTNLQQSSMWANFAVAETAPIVEPEPPNPPKPTPTRSAGHIDAPKWPNT